MDFTGINEKSKRESKKQEDILEEFFSIKSYW